MPIYLDDRAVDGDDVNPSAAPNLGAVMDWAARKLDPDGRILVEVQVDGQTLVGEALDAGRSTAIDSSEIRLYSADRRELVVTTLFQTRDRLGEARQLQAKAAEQLQRDEVAAAMQLVGSIIEIWQQTQSAVVNAARLMNIDLDAVSSDGQSLSELAVQLIDQLKAVRALLEVSDTVGLADELAYEWPATIDRWDRMIEQVVAACGK